MLYKGNFQQKTSSTLHCSKRKAQVWGLWKTHCCHRSWEKHGCHRRRGDSASAKEVYEAIHAKYPDNSEAVKHLVHICRDLELIDESNDYMKKLRRLEVSRSNGISPSRFGGGGEEKLGGAGTGTDDLEASGIMNSSQNPDNKSPTTLQRSGMGSFRAFGTGTVMREKSHVDEDEEEQQQQQQAKKKNDDLDLPGL